MGATDKELDSELGEFANRIEKLRIHYQGFFLGLEKLPPLFERDLMEKYIRSTSLNDAHRAVHKFRFMALLQRYRTLAVQWDRVMRELEEGKTTRESMRREAGYAAAKPSDRAGSEGGLPEAMSSRGRGRRAAKRAAAAAAEAGAAPEASDGTPVRDDPLMRLYTDYITARSSLGLPIEGITEPAFRASLEKQRQAQAEKLGVPNVSFSVVVKEGRVILLARPLKDAPGA